MKPSPLLLVFGIIEGVLTLMCLYTFLTLKIEWDMPRYCLAFIMLAAGFTVSPFCIVTYVVNRREWKNRMREIEERRVSYERGMRRIRELAYERGEK
jgi:uncharacterized membrane protein